MATTDPTYVGQVASVTGGIVRIRLRRDMPTTLVLVEGESYRVGQIGGFFRIPMGYASLYGVCAQVGADAVPGNATEPSQAIEFDDADQGLSGYRWMTIALFGEDTAGRFERGVGQYPTVGDEAHFVTSADLSVIYSIADAGSVVPIGTIAATSGIAASLNLGRLVTRHSAIVGSTGSGKSNLVRVILEGLASTTMRSARVLVIDPHGEYGLVAPGRVRAFAINPTGDEERLVIPFWALPFNELMPLVFGQMNANHEAIVRDRVQELKREAAAHLADAPDPPTITADSPVPFSIRRLWFELDDFERQTFRTVAGAKVATEIQVVGDADTHTSNVYEPYGPASREPLKNPAARYIGKQLEFARSRMLDPRYAFIFDPSGGYAPDLDGRVASDLASLLAGWVGHDRPLSVLNISDIPSDVAADLVGLLVRIVYETLFWADATPVSGRSQPLLVVLDEAHRFLPEGTDSAAFRTLTRIAKEGRKYGVGLMVVTQRPGAIDGTVLSQCGTMVALRTTNPKDRSRVASAFPDDLGGLVELLPSLRTGESLVVGEAMPVPSRVRIRHSNSPEAGSDPAVSARWTENDRPSSAYYNAAILNWRRQRRD
ncbi:ATP-binding protein [Aureimonas altamirensis]|uniref:ATP-binding protein n=1 Tax=Aureimonas altamirensis TaxID=370622 RepID=UPI001E4BEB7E|nr:ATP-binding protein [Aureimonas altamirensis]UHD44531.1 ATP-binding protein [Aureimonas altamirensis]